MEFWVGYFFLLDFSYFCTLIVYTEVKGNVFLKMNENTLTNGKAYKIYYRK